MDIEYGNEEKRNGDEKDGSRSYEEEKEIDNCKIIYILNTDSIALHYE
jgi:hypothetical protein